MREVKTYIEQAEDILEKGKKQGELNSWDFADAVKLLLIADGKYCKVYGTFENVNLQCLEKLITRIKKHPLIWKLFFMFIR